MSESKTPSTPSPAPASAAQSAETQRERWIKYGSNVVLTIVIVAVIAVALLYLAQKYVKRIDTTISNTNTLKPQTISIIGGVDQKIKLVGLYPANRNTTEKNPQDYHAAVANLLEEYQRKNGKIESVVIDPDTEQGKVYELYDEIQKRYGGGVQGYQIFLKEYPKLANDIREFSEGESKKLAAMSFDDVKDPALAQTLNITFVTIQGFPDKLDEVSKSVEKELQSRIPDYNKAMGDLRRGLPTLQVLINMVVDGFTKQKDEAAVPAPIRDYMNASLPSYQAIQKRVNDTIEKMNALGDIKQVDDFRRSGQTNSILVMGEKDMKVLPFTDVWRSADYAAALEPGEKPPLKFAGERVVNTAIVALTAKEKPKAVFIRPGGPPLFSGGDERGGSPFTSLVTRLRDANFEVLEKDLSGQWAMQAMMQARQSGMPPPAMDPSDEEIKDAVWIVIAAFPETTQMGPSMLSPKLAEHLKAGKPALVLSANRMDPLSSALKDWGVELKTQQVVVHEKVDVKGRSSDMIERVRQVPYIFVLNQYGDHPLAKPLNSIDMLMMGIVPVIIHKTDGYKATPLLPIPADPKTWGESDWTALQNGEVEFNPPKAGEDVADGDLPGPMFGGAVVEKTGGGRLVVIGGVDFVINQFLDLPDENLGSTVRRFPGNAELIVNSVYWLAGMDSMLAVSPTTMEINRIENLTEPARRAWGVGVLWVGLPLVVLAIGGFVYFNRRD